MADWMTPIPTAENTPEWMRGGPAGTPPPPDAASANSPRNILADPIYKSLGTSSGVEYYDRAMRSVSTLLPNSLKQSKGAEWMTRFGVELAKAGPELVDFAASPVGMALIGAHFFPATAPIAAIVDVGLGGIGLFKSVPEVGRAIQDGSPEAWAGAVKSVAFSLGMLKGGARTLVARSARLYLDPPAERARLRQALAAAPKEAKVPLLDSQHVRPNATRAEKVVAKAYGKPVLRDLASALAIPKPRLMQVSADIVADRASFLAVRNLDVNRMLYDFKREVPLEERAINRMGFVIEGTATPEEARLGPAARRWIPILREWTRQQDRVLKDAYGEDLPLKDAETYLTHIWDLSGQGQHFRARAARTLMRDPFLNPREKAVTYREGIEQYGMRPKYSDIADIYKRRADFGSQAIANQRMANWLRQIGALVSENEARKMNLEHYRPVEARALERAVYAGKLSGVESEGVILERRPAYVHPDFEMAVNSIFGEGFKGMPFATAEFLRSMGKKLALSFSMFHHWALSEQAHAVYFGQNKPIQGVTRTFAFSPEFWRGMKTGLWEVIGRRGDAPPVLRLPKEHVREWMDKGLNLNSEDMESRVNQQLREFAASNNLAARALRYPVKALSKALDGWDRSLWDFYHQGSMLDSAEMIFSTELKRMGPRATPEQIGDLRRTVAEHINNAYGAVSYDKMLLSPKFRQALNFFLLAPAWTLSNLRVLTGGLESEMGSKLVGKYVRGAAISWFISTQMMNYAMSGYYNMADKDGKRGSHFSWDNPGAPVSVGGHYLPLTANAFNIAAGHNQDGSQKYIVLGKGFREPLMWVLAPLETLGNKLSLPLRMLMVQITKHSPGSGFTEIDPKATEHEQNVQRALAVVEGLGLPFTLRDPVQELAHAIAPQAVPAPTTSAQFTPFGIPVGLPTRKGLSLMAATRAYTEALDAGNWDKAREVLSAAARNNVDPLKVVREYKVAKRKQQRQVRGPTVTYTEKGEAQRR